MKPKKIALIILLHLAFTAHAQVGDVPAFSEVIQMDSFVVRASRSGFDVPGFIKRVQQDTTFYKAFRSLHFVPYVANNSIVMKGENGKTQAMLHNKTKQQLVKGCRSMKVLEEEVTGDFYKENNTYRYYTAELFAYLFFTNGTVCNESDVIAGSLSDKGKGGLERSKWQLKQLIFNPGSKVNGIPFMGDRAAIFEPDEAKKYDFKLSSVQHQGTDCYLFQAFPKAAFRNDVVYNELSTWFRKGDFSIVARIYSLSFRTALYDFDVNMNVTMTNAFGRLLPSRIEYTGNWRAATQGRERGSFSAAFTY